MHKVVIKESRRVLEWQVSADGANNGATGALPQKPLVSKSVEHFLILELLSSKWSAILSVLYTLNSLNVATHN